MANHNKFNINNYIHYGYSSYEEYRVKANRINSTMTELIIEDAYKYLDLFESGYTLILKDIQDILCISNKNTIQTKIMRNIDKMYINKPVKDLFYLASKKTYKRGIPNITAEINLEYKHLERHEKSLLDRFNKLNLTPDFLIKRTFMKEEDVKEAICRVFKKEVITDGVKHYVDINEEEINLIMRNGLKSDKVIRNNLGFSNLNQIQRRISRGILPGYICRIALINEDSKVPLVRYLFK